MLKLQTIDRRRLVQPAALLCCFVLGLVALWLLVRLVWQLVPAGDAALATAPVRIDANASGSVPAQSIAKWHLFGASSLRSGGGSVATATTLSLILRGTLADADPRAGVALIDDAEHGERALSVGDEVVPGARLAAVYPDHVELDHQGVQETLRLARDTNLAPADVVRATPATVTGRAVTGSTMVALPMSTTNSQPAAQQVRPASGAAQTIAQLRRNPDELMRRVQIVPVLDGGKLSGVRLASADAALIAQFGLRPNDVITAVNGMPIDSFARGQQILSSLGDAGSARVTVQRDGQSAEITVALK